MPFPWKKNRVTRISQIVADLQSPKRGGSLVVETGFPTSLIDLFVKNRSRFKKPKSRKPLHLHTSDLPPPTVSPASPPLEKPEAPDSTDLVVACAEPSLAEAPSLRRLVGLGENVCGDEGVAGTGGEVNRDGECASGWDSNMVLAVFLKIFVVVVLTLSVKKLTIGITMSAFALLFLEYAGKRAVSFLRPCSNANMAVKSLAQSVSTCIGFQRLQLKMKKNCEGSQAAVAQGEIFVSELVGVAEMSSNSLSIEEIEVVETKSEVGFCCEENDFAGPELDSLSGDKKWDCPQMQEDSKGKVVVPCEISECKAKGSRSGKFKSKMVKKLVPRKFRCSAKKEKKGKTSTENEAESGSEVSNTVEIDKSSSFQIEEEKEDVGKEEGNNRNRSLLWLKVKLECIRDDEVDCGITCSQESPLPREEVAVSNKKRVDGVGNSGYIALLIIALAGLVLGRFPALILTMTWCFMLKIVETRGRSQNVPLIKCSIPDS